MGCIFFFFFGCLAYRPSVAIYIHIQTDLHDKFHAIDEQQKS